MLEIFYDADKLRKKTADRNNLADPRITAAVADIMQMVKSDGDKALKELTIKFDGCELDKLQVGEEEIEKAYKSVDRNMLDIVKEAISNVREYHQRQKPESWEWEKRPGMTLGQKVTPVGRAGVYVPGGTAPLVSSVIMNVVPASVAGVGEIIMCSPPGKDGQLDPLRITAAVEAGATAIYKVGGAQAIFAMAFGTQSIPRVDKITGPGNIYVAYAKKMAYGFCGIDMIAGPSEIMVIADSEADPAYAAADLLSQAEHDPMASSILVTFEKRTAEAVIKEVEKQLEGLPRKETASQSLKKYGGVYMAKNEKDAIEAINSIAPEHCELLVEKPQPYIDGIKNAGAIFVGPYSPEPLGDYWAGPNHTLPTGGTAGFYSPLGTYDFCKRTSVIRCDRENLEKDYGKIVDFARAEGLEAHARAVAARFKKEEG